MIANKAPATQPASNEVYLVWDDEAMSMVSSQLLFQMYRYSCQSFGCCILVFNTHFHIVSEIYPTGGKKDVISEVSGA